ncbi:MAG: hypothetical protein UHS54_08545 [Lachnospiraceae bacterium]|nr:hypothetical protein [Lachnospiraceae bacterium]
MGNLGGLFKKIKKEHLVLCFLFGILLLVAALPTSDSKSVLKENTTVSTNADALERQLEEALSGIEGIGEVQVTIALEPLVDSYSNPEITGVLVVCSTGDDPISVQKIQESVMTLFQLEAHKIKVMKMK